MMLLASVFLSVVPLFFHIMSAHHEVHAHVEKKGLPHIQKYFSLSPTLLSLSLSLTLTHTEIRAPASAHTHCAVRAGVHARRQSAVSFPQLVARKQNTLPVPALHTYTHTDPCAHTNSETALYTLLKGHDTN